MVRHFPLQPVEGVRSCGKSGFIRLSGLFPMMLPFAPVQTSNVEFS